MRLVMLRGKALFGEARWVDFGGAASSAPDRCYVFEPMRETQENVTRASFCWNAFQPLLS